MINYEILVTLIVASWIVAKHERARRSEMELFDFQVAGLVLALATAMVKVWEAFKDRLGERWTGASPLARELAGYGMMVVTGLIVLATGLDMAPGLNAALPWVGRAFTCVVGGIGPSLLYDIFLDWPETLASPDSGG